MNDSNLSRLLLEAFRALDGEIDHALADRGFSDLTPAQAAALLHIDRRGTRLTELSQRAQVTKQAMMQVVDDLESRGSVRRSPDPGDARAKIVRLTQKGERQRAEAQRAVAAVEARVRRKLGDRRYDGLRTALTELTGGEGEA